MKPVSEDKLSSVLDRAVMNLNRMEPQLLITVDGDKVKVKHSDILFCESFAHSTVITTTNKTYETRLSISELENRLGGGFIRSHRSYIAGISHIQRITKTDVIFDNGKAVPLSHQSYDMVNQAFIRFYRGTD
jgi:DNA-binding LytR/AlgR family response regulator